MAKYIKEEVLEEFNKTLKDILENGCEVESEKNIRFLAFDSWINGSVRDKFFPLDEFSGTITDKEELVARMIFLKQNVEVLEHTPQNTDCVYRSYDIWIHYDFITKTFEWNYGGEFD